MTLPSTAEQPVLSTLNRDGTRRWLRPIAQAGRFWRRRVAVAWALIALFVALPFVRLGGKPAVLLDLPRREFTFFGTTLLPTDSVLLMLLMLGIFLGIFLLTALFGRVWCGWACPQTVYLEFVFRPLERLIEGSRRQQDELDRHRFAPRRVLKFAVFVVLAVVVANVFLAYFVPVDVLVHWITEPPARHPAGFAVVAVTSSLMFMDFAYFREQMCIVACPYARLQSVLLDRQSLIVAYDPKRGEPRGKLSKKDLPRTTGDCIDCRACVLTCPTGIDIRDGLQMECIGCTQCIDACDAVMDRIERPRGLIRYTSQAALENVNARRILRPRVVAYPLALAIIAGLFGQAVSERGEAEVTVLRGLGAPFTAQPDGNIINQLRIRVLNHGVDVRAYRIEVRGPDGRPAADMQLVAPENPLRVHGKRHETTSVFAVAPLRTFQGGARALLLRISDGEGFRADVPIRLLGPEALTNTGDMP